MKNAHYVYKITNINPVDERQFYIGVRTAPSGNPEEDTKYMSSSKYLKEAIKKQGKDSFVKEILSTWETRELAILEEIRLHDEFDVLNKREFYNRSKQKTSHFDTTGLVTAFDKKTNTFVSVEKHIFDNDENLSTFNNDKIFVFDTLDNTKKFINVDEFKHSDRYKFHTKGMVAAKNIITRKIEYITKEEYKNSDHHEHTAKGTVVARNKITNVVTRIPKSVFDTDSNWISLNLEKGLSNIIDIFNSQNELVKTYFGNFDPMCRKDGLPYHELSKSYKSGGNYKLYPLANERKDLNSRLINNGNIKYVGWYAKIR